MGGGGQMLMFADKVGGWGWPNAEVSKKNIQGMVFCYQNCSDQKKLLKFEAEGREFAKVLISLEQFIQIVKGQNNFW